MTSTYDKIRITGVLVIESLLYLNAKGECEKNSVKPQRYYLF